MRWANPELLPLLWLVPLLLVLAYFAERRRASVERAIGDPRHLRARAMIAGSGLRWGRLTLLLLAAALAIAGVARPQAGFRLVTTTSRGVDLVVALDLSHSMEARDVRPDRLRAAKRELLSLFSALEGSAIGVVEFAGNARVLSPLTTDSRGLESVVETAVPEDLQAPGSDLGAAVKLSAILLRRPGERPRAVLLVSDGENLEGDPRASVGAARAAGARVFTLGMGTPQGGTIPIVDSTGAVRGRRLDLDGKVVTTRLDESMLRDIARRGGGRYERGDGTGRAALHLADAIRSEGGVEARGQTVRAYDERFPWFAAAAGLILVAERLVPRRRRS
ncbi:MAG TPA: VWA domain-containing protein [Candidatus Eisenbacteria bacterium]|jgi:Ca-activated chloride channel family protein|nr:VWA domain-containing protein [Candidatus Eisenbacteria bacterium]